MSCTDSSGLATGRIATQFIGLREDYAFIWEDDSISEVWTNLILTIRLTCDGNTVRIAISLVATSTRPLELCVSVDMSSQVWMFGIYVTNRDV